SPGLLARDQMFRGCDHLWRAWRSSAMQTPGETTVVGLEMKPVGEPYAGNPHVRFDERGVETERWPHGAKQPRLSSTLPLRFTGTYGWCQKLRPVRSENASTAIKVRDEPRHWAQHTPRSPVPGKRGWEIMPQLWLQRPIARTSSPSISTTARRYRRSSL